MNSIQRIAISVVGIAALACVAGCGTSTKEVDSTTYVPAAAPASRRAGPAGTGGSSDHNHQHVGGQVARFE